MARLRQRRAGMGVVRALHRGDFHVLIVERVQTMLVAGQDLDGRHRDGHPQRHREHQPRFRIGLVAQQMPGADAADDERRRQVGR